MASLTTDTLIFKNTFKDSANGTQCVVRSTSQVIAEIDCDGEDFMELPRYRSVEVNIVQE